MENNLKTITFKRKRGIDDLKGLFAFVGSWGQGDHYYSNDCSLRHPSYVEFVFDCDKTQEKINEEINRRIEENEKYIFELKEQNRYGEEYDISFSFIPHPLFDEENCKQSCFTSSYFFININEDGK